VHYLDTGGDADAPVMVLVHGLGASHLSWHPVIPLLARSHRVIAPDLPGFGHSDPLGRSTSVADNRDHLVRLVRSLTDQPVVLVGNSMGGMIAILTADAHPSLVSRLVLVNPALPGSLTPRALRDADPRVALHFLLYNTPLLAGPFLRLRRARSTPAQQVAQLLEQVTADPARIPADTVERLVSLATTRRDYAWSDAAFLSAERSIIQQLTTGRRRYLAAIDRLSMPTLLVHGEVDKLVHASASKAIAPRNPRIDLELLPDVGHAPQLEVPTRLVALVDDWLTIVGDRRAV
jgi:pimeloyl-ACP methyl ester carboxylesterase